MHRASIAAVVSCSCLAAQAPAPPAANVPDGAIVLFDGGDLSRWRAGAPDARWAIDGRALVAPPGARDLVTRGTFATYHLHLEFWLPAGADASSGVFIGGRREIEIRDSHGEPLRPTSCGAIFGVRAPDVDASLDAGEWQALDVVSEHFQGEAPRLSAWLNGRRIHDAVAVPGATAGGTAEPLPGAEPPAEPVLYTSTPDEAAARFDLGSERFTIAARFRTATGGTIVAKCAPGATKWTPNAKALFVRGGRLVYDVGWVGAMTSPKPLADGEWHDAVVTYRDGEALMFVDGSRVARRGGLTGPDVAGHVLKIGRASNNFAGDYRGTIGRVRYWRASLDDAALEALAHGGDPGREPELDWRSDSPIGETRWPPPPVAGPIRLQAPRGAVRFANVWVAPLDPVDHAGVIAGWDESSLERGEKIFRGLCANCHGLPGQKPVHPLARAFGAAPFENGSDPYALWRTLTHGFKTMPPQTWLEPARRYDVIHYIREAFLRPSQRFAVDPAYLAGLPKGARYQPSPPAGVGDAGLARRDFGPALASQLGTAVGAAFTVDLGQEVAISYDLQRLAQAGAWQGGFLDLRNTQHYMQRGEGRATPGGRALENLGAYRWGFGRTLDYPADVRRPRAPLPEAWLRYRGHYLHGRKVVLSYEIDGRAVLEMPAADRMAGFTALRHDLRVEPGTAALVLQLGQLDDPESTVLAGLCAPGAAEPRARSGPAAGRIAVARTGRGGFCAAAVLGDTDGLRLEVDAAHRLVLRLPPADDPRNLRVIRAGGDSIETLARFGDYVRLIDAAGPVEDVTRYTRGGPRRWDETLITRGELGDGGGAYALDTLTLPPDNPWNAWLRTSALDCFDDGRIAVSTYGGDVWVVSGVDDDLDELRWQRVASGMFEPMGLRIVDGVIHVTCRDRITRLHDLNGDGEADFYESFFADPDVSTFFHSFNFDLQTDDEGNFYYAKSGRYTDFSLEGAVVKVSPDGREFEFFCTGFRTPNGMGTAPGNRIFASDNQGNWIPASKVSLVERGGFYGLFKTAERERPDFDRPILWMPQEFDSSSGGQLWVDDPRWGPLSGRLLHTSFGKGWMYALAMQRVGDVTQAAAWKLPFQFAAGIQRARGDPRDGQVYAVGLSGWQGPAGGADGCLQRVRYTGRPARMLLDARVRRGAIALTFSCALDPASARDVASYAAEQWNYRWTAAYGSPHFSVEDPDRRGHDPVAIASAELEDDGRTVALSVPELVPVDQLRIEFDVRAAGGQRIEDTVYLTIHRVPD